MGPWKIQPYGRALLRNARDMHMTARLLHEAIYHRQPEAAALPHFLGREERLEDALQGFGGHPRSSVGDFDQRVLSGRQTIFAWLSVRADNHIVSRNGDG